MKFLKNIYQYTFRFNLIIGRLLIMGIVGCQSLPYQPYARDVKKRPQQSGLIALNLNHRQEDSALAQKMMASNCGQLKVKVIEEGEVVIGEKTTSNSNQRYESGESDATVGHFFGMPVVAAGKDPSTKTSAEASRMQIKEWQINYECENEIKSTSSSELQNGKQQLKVKK